MRDLIYGLRWIKSFIGKLDHDRFETYPQRRAVGGKGVCEVGPFELLMSQGVLECLEWKGRPLFKTVYEFACVPMLLHEMRPGTIFEIGSGTGASALWMADVCMTGGLSTRIHSVDIQQVPDALTASVTFHKGDTNSPETLFPADVLQTAKHPWLVIEDAHVNVPGVLRYFDSRLRPGDYLIVEDSRDKQEHLAAVINDRYRVDTRYTDFFGRNATSAEDSIFKVVC